MQFIWFFLFIYLTTSFISYVVQAADDPKSWSRTTYKWSDVLGENVVRALYIFGIYWSFIHLLGTF